VEPPAGSRDRADPFRGEASPVKLKTF